MKSQDPSTDSQSAYSPWFAPKNPGDLSGPLHRLIIGFLGLSLPGLLYTMARVRPTEGLETGKLLDSVSAYYYTGAVPAYIGIIFALAIALLIYEGYDGKKFNFNRLVGIIACVAAIGVAFFPTTAPIESLELLWWTSNTLDIHNISAGVLFLSFFVFSYFLFPKSNTEEGVPLDKEKKRRNVIYKSCGVAILACIAWVCIANLKNEQIFWPETFALIAFAISWLVKGGAVWTATSLIKRTIYFAPRPRELVDRSIETISNLYKNEKTGKSP